MDFLTLKSNKDFSNNNAMQAQTGCLPPFLAAAASESKGSEVAKGNKDLVRDSFARIHTPYSSDGACDKSR